MKKEILIRDALGNKVSGTLSVPKGASLVVVMSHGFTSNKNTNLFLELEKEFNSKGLGTLRYEYYGHGKAYGHERGVSSDITLTKAVESLKAMIKYVRQMGYQVGLIGSSFGGLVSIVAASRYREIKFLALRSPVTNPVEFWNERISSSELDGWKENSLFHYNREGEDYTLEWGFRQDLEKYNSRNLANKISCPVFIVHGSSDLVVPIKYSRLFSKRTGAQLFEVEGADHRYTNKKYYAQMKTAIKNFVFSQKPKIKAVIFDWNGVLVDSLKLDHKIFLEQAKMKNLKVPRSVSFYSNMYNDNVFVCLQKIGFATDEAEEKNYRKLYMDGLHKTKPFPGIRPLLKSLKRKYKLGIITSNYRIAVETFFEKERLEKMDIILSSDVDRRKENKIKIFLEKFSLKKEEVIFVGDTVSDIKACKTAGIRIIANTWGYQSRAALSKHNPDFITEKPQDILKIIEGLK